MVLDLSIVLITYNRSAYLRKTLTTLSESAFKDCDIWILNNASSDDTLQVCQELNTSLPHLHIITHRYNIGGPANILRAYEHGNHYYTWLLCDDDVLLLDRVDDLVEALERKECDLIRIYGGLPEEQGRVSTLEELLHDPNSFTFYSLGFLPALIYRQDRLGPCAQFGYRKIHTAYPQLFVLFKAFDLSTKIYTTATPLLQRGEAPMSIGSEILLYQIQSLEALPSKRAKQVAMGWRRKRQKLFGYLLGYGKLILIDLRFGRPRRMIASIWWKTIQAAPSWIGKLTLLMNGVFIFAPIRPIYRLIRKKPMETRSFPDR